MKHVVDALTLQAESCLQMVMMLFIFNQVCSDKRKRVAMLLWCLWRQRNEKLWDNIDRYF